MNKILRKEYSQINNEFIDNEKYSCNRSKLHLNKREINLLIDNIFFSVYDDISD